MVLNFFFFYAFIHKVEFHINFVWSFFLLHVLNYDHINTFILIKMKII